MRLDRKFIKDHSAWLLSWLAFLLALTLVYARLATGALDRSFFYNSDTLFLPAFFRDIFQERGLFRDWWLPPAPYLFPDIPLYCLTNFAISNYHLAIVFSGVLQITLFMAGLAWLSRRMLGRQPAVQSAVLIAGALFYLRVAGGLPVNADRHLWLSTLSTAFHFGALLAGVYMLALLLAGLDCTFKRRGLAGGLLLLAALFALSTLTVASDLLFVLQTLLPALAGLAFLCLLGQVKFLRLAALALPLVASVPAGVALNRSVAGLHVKSYIEWGPAAIAHSWAEIRGWSAEVIRAHPALIAAWMLFMAASLAVAAGAVLRVRRKEPINRGYVFFFTFFPLAVAANFAGLILTGQSAPRYFIPVYIIPTFLGWPLLLGGLRRPAALAERFWLHHAAALALAVFALSRLAAPSQPEVRALARLSDYYPGHVRQLDEWARPRHWKYGIGDYWNGKQISMLSKAGLRMTEVYPEGHPQLWINSQGWYNREFDFILPERLRQDMIFTRFGEPRETLRGSQAVALAYDTPQFRQMFKGHTVNARLDRDGAEFVFYPAQQAGKVGEVDGFSRLAGRRPTPAGLLVLGPYLKLTPGEYLVEVAAQTAGPQTGHTEVVNPSTGLVYGGRKFPPTGRGIIPFSFTLKEEGFVEMRSHYSGTGLLKLESIRMKKLAPQTVTVDVFGDPGAPTFRIRDAVLAKETPKSHHDLWIIEGGVNDCFWFGATTTTLAQNYLGSLNAIADHATSCGAHVFFQELTPVIPEIVDRNVPKTAPNEPKVVLLNQLLRRWAARRHVRVIPVYQEFKPHWTATPEGWCLYENSDSVHPNARGNRALGEAWARAIRETVKTIPRSSVRVAVYGDSITAATRFKEEEKPATWMKALLEGKANPLTEGGG